MSREAFENYMALYWKLNGRWPDSEQVWQAATAEQAEQLTIAMQRIAELEKDVDILQTNLDAALRDKAQLSSEMAEAYNADYATVKVCASVLRNMAAAAEDRDGDK